MAKIMLKNVRLSFPSLFKKSVYNGESGKFEATFLINKETQADIIKQLEAGIDAVLKEKNKGKKIPAEKICLKDGDFAEYDGYEGHMSIKAGNNRRPTVIDRDKAPLAEEDGVLYAGCYVNAIVDFWWQDNSYGKRINCNLLGVQFSKDGEAFGAGDQDVTDDFDELEDEF